MKCVLDNNFSYRAKTDVADPSKMIETFGSDPAIDNTAGRVVSCFMIALHRNDTQS